MSRYSSAMSAISGLMSSRIVRRSASRWLEQSRAQALDLLRRHSRAEQVFLGRAVLLAHVCKRLEHRLPARRSELAHPFTFGAVFDRVEPVHDQRLQVEHRQRIVVGSVLVAHASKRQQQGDRHARPVLARVAVNEHAARLRVRDGLGDAGNAGAMDVDIQPIQLGERGRAFTPLADIRLLVRRQIHDERNVDIVRIRVALAVPERVVDIAADFLARADVDDRAHAVVDERLTPAGREAGDDVGAHESAASNAATVRGGQAAGIARVERAFPVEYSLFAGHCRRQRYALAQTPWQRLNFLPLPHQHGSLRPTFGPFVAGAALAVGCGAPAVAVPAPVTGSSPCWYWMPRRATAASAGGTTAGAGGRV